MENLLLTLGIGVAAAFMAFVLIYRLTHLRAYQVSLVVIFAMLCVFLPLQFFLWEGADVFAIHLALFVIVPYAMGIITAQRESGRSDPRQGRRRFHWAPTTIVVFFLVIAAVNAVIVTLANKGMPDSLVGRILPEPRSGAAQVTSFFPGTVAHDYFKKDALLHEHLEQLAMQEARGWQVRQGWLQAPRQGQTAIFQVKVTDRDGRPLENAWVGGEFARPSDAREDHGFELQAVAPGIYRGSIVLPMPGAWEVRLRVERGGEIHEQRGMTSVREG